MNDDRWTGLDPATIALHAGRGTEDDPGGPTNVPPVLASIYRPGTDVLYARSGNPTWSAFEETLGALEGGAALTFASGMAAESALFDCLEPGARVLAPPSGYYGTLETLQDRARRGSLSVEVVDTTDSAAVVEKLDGADLLWIETPSNPLMGICDLTTLCREAGDRGVTVVVDNTFATPMLQTPLSFGATLVVHSVTKYIAGHSDIVMGAVVTSDAGWYERILDRRSTTGAIPGPMEAFLALRGLRSLPVRIEKAQSNAMELATRLDAHPKVERVLYPGLASHPGHDIAAKQMTGFGAMLSFLVTGDATEADRVCDSTRIIMNATSLGGIETSMERRARWPNERAAPENLIRVSVGCEALEDLWTDLTTALA